MGVAAYNRGSELISRQADQAAAPARRRTGRRIVKDLYRRALHCQRQLAVSSRLFHESCRRMDWASARRHRREGRELQRRRAALVERIRQRGWPVSEVWLERTALE